MLTSWSTSRTGPGALTGRTVHTGGVAFLIGDRIGTGGGTYSATETYAIVSMSRRFVRDSEGKRRALHREGVEVYLTRFQETGGDLWEGSIENDDTCWIARLPRAEVQTEFPFPFPAELAPEI